MAHDPSPPTLTGEQYGKMVRKYHEGGNCQSVYVLPLQGIFKVAIFLIISVEMVAPFNIEPANPPLRNNLSAF